MRPAAGELLGLVPTGLWDTLGQLLPARRRPNALGDKVWKVAQILGKPTPDAVYRQLVSYWIGDTPVLRDGPLPQTLLDDDSVMADVPAFVSRMQFLDQVTYLPDDILTKVDRASMGVALEARVPLLDHRVVEYAWRIPLAWKVRDGVGKWILRRVLERYVPRALFDRPKAGFGVPIGAWLRGPLRDWAEDLLDESRMRQESYLDPEPIRVKWREHLTGRANWEYLLWDVLMFQAWLRRWSLAG
jgi:asparagine synthase (glutamine-hydrolysing)